MDFNQEVKLDNAEVIHPYQFTLVEDFIKKNRLAYLDLHKATQFVRVKGEIIGIKFTTKNVSKAFVVGDEANWTKFELQEDQLSKGSGQESLEKLRTVMDDLRIYHRLCFLLTNLQ